MKISVLAVTIAAMTMVATNANAGETASAPGAKVYFIGPENGATVKSPVKVVFGLSTMGVAPAGTEKANTGHHHLLVDRAPFLQGSEGAEESNANIPSDDNHVHFGAGQTETMLKLPAGKHTLQLILGDKDHIPHNPAVYSDVITITVE